MRKSPLLAVLGLLITSATMAAVPSQMNVQGRLLNAGTPMSGSHPAEFRIYDGATGGTPLWTESSTLIVQGGIFTATLGLTTPIPTIAFDSSSRWLEVTVEGSTLAPRLQLTTSAYAFRSQHADTANFAFNSASSSSELWSTDGTNVSRAIGSVGINGLSATGKLHVSGPITISDGLDNTSSRPAVGLGRIPGEISGVHTPGDEYWDDGFLRLSVGGATHTDAKTFIDLSGYSTVPDMHQNIVFGTSGVERMRVFNNGNIGIGTSIPQGRLDLASGAGNELVFSGGGDGNIFAPNQDLRIDAGTGWSLLLGADGIANQVVIQTHRTTINGNLDVNGSFTATGTKCRVVATTFGELKLNAVEAGHALFMDDEPSARLVNGRCRVSLSPKFLATVTVNGKYPLAVNVTFYGRHGGEWYVERDATGFTVIDPSGSNAEFSWQAIARQRDYEDLNLDPVTQAAAK